MPQRCSPESPEKTSIQLKAFTNADKNTYSLAAFFALLLLLTFLT